MAGQDLIEPLTPLDILMPRTYVGVALIFATTEPSSSIIKRLRSSLNILADKIPWLSGQVFPVTSGANGRPWLEIRGAAVPRISYKGTISGAYTELKKKKFSPGSIPNYVWPLPGMIDEELFQKGAPVFGASLFDFADSQGIGLCIYIHHHAIDATGLIDVAKMWTKVLHGQDISDYATSRGTRLADSLSPQLEALSETPLEQLFELRPEFSTKPLVFPAELPPCDSKLFTIPIGIIDRMKEELGSFMAVPPTANTIACALLWSTITYARTQRDPDLGNTVSKLATVVNGRRRISTGFSTSDNPYLANVALSSFLDLPTQDIVKPAISGELGALANLCEAIARSQSAETIDAHHIAQVYSLADQIHDYTKVSYNFDLLNERDLLVTSWGNLDAYGLDFGPGLGVPDYLRVTNSPMDGICLALPRRRMPEGSGSHTEVLEFIVMLRPENMRTMEENSLWKRFEVSAW